MKKFAAYFPLMVILAWFSISSLERAKTKAFWVDEGLELTESCSDTFLFKLKNGAAGQCSPHPLYYMMESGFVRMAENFSSDPFVSLRLPNVIFALAVIAGIYLFALFYFGWFVATVAALSLTQHLIFHVYAVESRVYIFWVALYLACTLFSFSYSRKKFGPGFSAAQLGLAAAVAPGMMQAWGFCAAVCLLWAKRAFPQVKTVIRPVFIRIAPVLIGSLAIGLYYALRACTDGNNAGSYDLLHTWDPALVKGIVRFFLPTLPHWAWPTYAIGIAGWIRIGWELRKFFSRRPADLLAEIAMVVCCQLLVTVAIGLAIAWSHYYFVPRMFLHLLVVQALVVALGADWIWRSGRALAKPAMVVLGALFAISSLPKLNSNLTLPGAIPTRQTDCAGLNKPVTLLFPESFTYHDKLNAYGQIARELGNCPNVSRDPDRPYLVVEKEGEAFRASPAASNPGGFAPALVCHDPISFQ